MIKSLCRSICFAGFAALTFTSGAAHAGTCLNNPNETLVFGDDFERPDGGLATDDIGNGWETNSPNRAQNQKQVELVDGQMVVTRHPVANHAVSVRHDAPWTNGRVHARFMINGDRDHIGINIADLELETVHAGHLFFVKVSHNTVTIQDSKWGRMDQETWTRRKAGEETEADKARHRAASKRINRTTEKGVWHDLDICVEGDKLSVFIDQEYVGSHVSPGFAHETKRTLRFNVAQNLWVEEVQVYSTDTAELAAAGNRTLVFADDFERAETVADRDDVQNGWRTNSSNRAEGNKQAWLTDGTLVIRRHKVADHAVSLSRDVETPEGYITDGAVSMRFMALKAGDRLTIGMTDTESDEVHIGHLFAVRVYPSMVELREMKTGTKNLVLMQKIKDGTLTAEEQAEMDSKTISFPFEIQVGEWHELDFEFIGETQRVTIDGVLVAEQTSPGIAHETKRALRMGIAKGIVLDDIRIYEID